MSLLLYTLISYATFYAFDLNSILLIYFISYSPPFFATSMKYLHWLPSFQTMSSLMKCFFCDNPVILFFFSIQLYYLFWLYVSSQLHTHQWATHLLVSWIFSLFPNCFLNNNTFLFFSFTVVNFKGFDVYIFSD